ncbi:Carbon-nitrogen hydrolase [Serendipita sp. 407]|nr:Carbon-nitrogen hydrolase [Serendipita sp. 407]
MPTVSSILAPIQRTQRAIVPLINHRSPFFIIPRQLSTMASQINNRRLRIGMVQYDPKITQVEANMKRVRAFLKDVEPGSLDLLCLSEMALTGYVFPTPNDVLPYLEDPKTGVTSQFCAEIARELGCFVIGGYPEKLREDEEHPGNAVGANSAVIYNPNGERVGDYRKTNMYEADLPWVKPGTGFAHFPNLSPALQDLTLGICMDVNPMPDVMSLPAPCELASFALSKRSRVLVLLCAWLANEEDLQLRWCLSNIEFWIQRTLPLWSKDSPDLVSMSEYPAPDDHDETILVVCNRTGTERGTKFAGSSIVVRCSRSQGKYDIIGLLETEFEGFRSWTIE